MISKTVLQLNKTLRLPLHLSRYISYKQMPLECLHKSINTTLATLLVIICVLISACAERPSVKSDTQDGPGNRLIGDETPDAIPRIEPKSRYGNPDSYIVMGKRYQVLNSSKGFVERGIASWYGKKFHGRRTSSGDPYDMYAMSAAHKRLPLPTYVRVTNLENERSIVVRVNDRGPFHDNRVIDLSYAAAKKLDIVAKGTGLVEVRAIGPTQHETAIYGSQPRKVEKPEVYIQLGAFSSRQNAEMLRDRLKTHALGRIHILEGIHKDTRLFKVRIGPLSSIHLADQTAERLQRLGMRDYRVVID